MATLSYIGYANSTIDGAWLKIIMSRVIFNTFNYTALLHI